MNRIILIDFNALHFKYCFGYKHLQYNNQSFGGVYGWFKNIFFNVEQFKINNIIFVLDGKNSKKQKQVILPCYKTNRPKNTDIDWFLQYKIMIEMIEILGLKILKDDNLEADQLIAECARQLSKNNKVLILTNDKDYLQLIEQNVSILMLYPYETVLFNNKDDVFKKIGIYPEQLVDYLTIAGDSSDNIPGIPTIGVVTAKKLLNKYENLNNIYDNLGELTEKHQKLFIEHKPNLLIFQKMICLKKVETKLDWAEVDCYINNFKINDLKGYCLAKKPFVSRMTDMGINIWKL